MSRKLLPKWAKITKQNLESLSFAEPDYISDATNNVLLKQWMLRKCDVEDYIDWLPFRIDNNTYPKCSYVNVNPKSERYHHYITLEVKPPSAELTLWLNGRIIITWYAAVEKIPSVRKPTVDEITDIAEKLNL